jgi:hypothetical protein
MGPFVLRNCILVLRVFPILFHFKRWKRGSLIGLSFSDLSSAFFEYPYNSLINLFRTHQN